MEPTQLKDLRTRLLSGESLSAAEQQALGSELECDPRARADFLADETMDSLLQAAARLPGTHEEFVQATLRRIVAEATSQCGPPPRQPAPSPARAVAGPPQGRGWRTLGGMAAPAFFGRRRWAVAGACLAVSLLIGLTIWLQYGRKNNAPGQNGSAVTKHDRAAPDSDGVHRRAPQSEARLATLVKTDEAAWDVPRAVGARLARGRLHLVRGSAELHLDRGTVVCVTGPATFDLRGPDEIYLRRGLVAAQVPASAVGFTLTTPVSRVVDLGTEFEVRVDESGATEAVVRRGKVKLKPQREGERPAKSVELVAGELDRASVSLLDTAAPLLPVTTTVRGSRGGFLGLVSVEGKTVEFRSPDVFREFQASVLKQLRESPDQFRQQWSVNVQASGAGARASAWVEIDGQRHEVQIEDDDADAGVFPAAPAIGDAPMPEDIPDARQLLREQLENARQQNADHPALKKLLDDMLRQLDDM